jgi:hypothetical protein
MGRLTIKNRRPIPRKGSPTKAVIIARVNPAPTTVKVTPSIKNTIATIDQPSVNIIFRIKREGSGRGAGGGSAKVASAEKLAALSAGGDNNPPQLMQFG